jgi:Flp pilus assembly protein TadB
MRQIERRTNSAFENKRSKQAKAAESSEQLSAAEEEIRKQEIERKFNLQTPKTQEMMKESQKKADEFNNPPHECFLKRFFKKIFKGKK